MTGTQKIAALEKIVRFVHLNPDFATLDKATNLIDILSDDPDLFWSKYFEMTGDPGPHIGTEEELLAEGAALVEQALVEHSLGAQ